MSMSPNCNQVIMLNRWTCSHVLYVFAETLNIFPSQAMHGEPSPTSTASPSGPPVAGSSSRRSLPPPLTVTVAGRLLAAGKVSKGAFKREASKGGAGAGAVAAGSELKRPKTPDPKTLRRLAQNREAARKSRLRKKAYIQQLESGRIRLAHLEQELQLTRAQGALWGSTAGTLSPDAALFNWEYERWQEVHHKVIGRLRAAVEEHRPDGELQPYVDEASSHYEVLMCHKARLASGDPLHLLSGLWKGAVERCFIWMGGSRPSELIKVVLRHVEPLTEQQLAAVCGVQQAARREEDALDGGLEALLRSLSDVISSDAPQTTATMYHHHHPAAAGAAMAASYMGQYNLHLAVDKLASLAAVLRQADELRMRTMHTLRQMLTVRQSARCFVAVDDYFGRLRALSLFWCTSRQPPG
ncbi:hypothetical protein GUJ93_ZPchr0006g45521 [Zizania palustris]|uniref:Uncharacterized protein n=1 Tax=Zizania palustris TaxID=103762 RepID=A0A8J5SFZ9_ZIZPA|nr:hypothetical protein GUJ93_ZPchr0006g45521 [Zizania palustris]